MTLEGTSDLLGLSVELILEIASYLEPIGLVNLALTCSCLHRQVNRELQQHQKYHYTSDLSPRAILKLLEPNSRCSIINSYVRHIEIWGSRRSWEDWSDWKLLRLGEFQTVKKHDLMPPIKPEESMKYLELAKGWWDMPEEDNDAARAELESGGDGFIKMLLFASYHRLQSIKFVKRGEENHTSLQWLAKAVDWSRISGNWPPGFQSIRHIAVGVVGGMELDSQVVDRRAVDLAAVLNLPNIDRVYFNDLSQQRERWGSDGEEDESDDEPPQNYHLPRFSSSVQHLYLDSPRELTDSFREALFTAPEKLKTIAIKGCVVPEAELDGSDIIVDYMAHEYKDTLESLIFYNMNSGLHGYRCAVYDLEQFEYWSKLKRFSIDMEALELHGDCDSTWTSEELIEAVGKRDVFSCSMEVLMLCGIYDKPSHTRLEDDVDWYDVLDEMLVALIKSKDKLYQHLKVIYVDIAERHVSTQRSKPAFQKAIAAGRDSGVHVHTLTNRDDGGCWKRFPVAPDRFDLKTGLFGSRPSTWKANRFTGIWEEPDCEGCGECKECLRVYPEHVWKTPSAARYGSQV